MMNKPELLAPAGNMECLIAAVRNGADAVYFGGGAFNARKGAANFTGDALREAIDFCRLRGVKTHITLNTLLLDRELEAALDFAALLYSLKADAVIVQDIGLAALIRKELPLLTVHASTQMGIHSIGGLRYCEKSGVSRAVLAREVPLCEIRRMHENSPVELEFFCHGALCMGFSGSCLYSSMAGERSGNRGTCAQPCRKNATVLSVRAGQDEFALSTNDIMMLDMLPELAAAGICSLKIEGRMKSPEYVTTVTRIYRAALDGEPVPDSKGKLFKIFNRGEFSTAHLTGDSVTTGHVGRAKPDKALIAEAHESVRQDRQTRPLGAYLSLEVGRSAELTLVSEGFSAKAAGPVCEAPNKPIDLGRLAEQLKKLGGTPFYLEKYEIAGSGYVPVSAINAMRREAAEKLSRNIIGSPDEKPAITAETVERNIRPAGAFAGEPIRYLRVRDLSRANEPADIIGFDPVFPGETDPGQLKKPGKKLVLILPNVIMTERSREAYERLLSSGVFSGVEANNISEWEMGRDLPIRIAGIGMNAFNSAAATELIGMGFTHFMPSPELTRPQLKGLAERFGDRMIVNVFGRVPVMQLMHCPVKEYKGCRACRGSAGLLSDGEGRRFPLENVRFPDGYCLVRMLNSAVTDIRGEFKNSGISVFGAAETPDENENAPVTRGHWARPVE